MSANNVPDLLLPTPLSNQTSQDLVAKYVIPKRLPLPHDIVLYETEQRAEGHQLYKWKTENSYARTSIRCFQFISATNKITTNLPIDTLSMYKDGLLEMFLAVLTWNGLPSDLKSNFLKSSLAKSRERNQSYDWDRRL